MAEIFKSFIPAEFLQAWTTGDYVLGPSTLNYQHAGLALILRGYYRYDVFENDNLRFSGYAIVYIQGSELTFSGLRLYDRQDTAPSKEQPPLFWRSVFSKFVGHTASETEIYLPYRIFEPSSFEFSSLASELTARIRKQENASLPDTLESIILKKSGAASASQELPDDAAIALHAILRFLSHRQDSTNLGRPTLCALCVLDRVDRPNGDERWDLVLDGQYYGVVVDGTPVAGTVKFRRLARPFIDRIEEYTAVDQKSAAHD